ncbi:hypothetical protein Pmani_036792 [Petrolisthes manimaculis]|uniref:Regulatory protein zeste n=1 Tax=Petrolisthes manimaculis TaxID=1843537 RepID=A0AAE1NJS9_9EUCA|nr:hypothetical protein Pmani_036792 [Petrolisthes manimaculis]
MEEERIGIDGDEGDDGNGQRQSTTTTTTAGGGGAGLKKLHMDREEAVKKQVILLKYFRKDGKKSRSYSRKRSSQTSSSKSEKEDDLPDGAAIDIYLDMWEGVFTFVPKMKAWSIFEANHWDVKKTMIELEKLDKQNKAEQNQQSEEQNSLLKTEVSENSEDQRMLGVTEEVEMFTMNSVEKLKAEKESVSDNVRSTSPVLHESIRATSSVLLSGCRPPKKSVVGGENCHTSMTTNNTLSLGTPPSHPAIVCVANPEMQEELEKNVKVEIVVKEENMMETEEEDPCESKENMMETEEEEPCESEKEFEEVGNSSGMSLRNVRLPRLSDSQDESLQKYLTKSSQKFPDKQKTSTRPRFKESWLDNEMFSSWLARVKNNPKKAYCKVCHKYLSAETTSLKRHSKCRVHKTLVECHSYNTPTPDKVIKYHNVTCLQEKEVPIINNATCSQEKEVPIINNATCLQEKEVPIINNATCSQEKEVPIINNATCSQEKEVPIINNATCSQEKEVPIINNATYLQEKEVPIINTKDDVPVLHGAAYATILFLLFLAEHNLPLSLCDSFLDLTKRMFPDSKIAMYMAMRRSKCKDLVQGSGDYINRQLSDKRARLMSSSNEENNDDDDDDDDDEGKDNWDSNTNKEQVNGDSHNNTSEDDDMPDGAAIDKYLEMWDMVYNFVSKMESLEIFRANHWDVRETMIELGKLDKQYKAQLKQRREDVEKTSKKKAAEKREKLRMLGLAEREQEMLPRQHMKERLKTHKESVKGTNLTTQLVAHNTGSDRHTTQPHQLPLKLKCSAQKALPLTQHQQDQLLSLIKDREVTLTCPAFDPKARCWEEITRLFNASHPQQHPRSPKQLKQCWKNIRRSTRNKALKAAYLQLRRTTDEGPPTNTPKYSQYLEMAIDLAMGEMAEEFGEKKEGYSRREDQEREGRLLGGEDETRKKKEGYLEEIRRSRKKRKEEEKKKEEEEKKKKVPQQELLLMLMSEEDHV